MKLNCAICGMPPGPGGPCCTREYAVKVIKRQDEKIRQLEGDLATAKHEAWMAANGLAIQAETNETLRRMIADIAAVAGCNHGVDEPVLNAASVREDLKALMGGDR